MNCYQAWYYAIVTPYYLVMSFSKQTLASMALNYGYGTSVHLILKHSQHYPECGWTTNVLLHIFCAQLQVITGGLSHKLLYVLVDLQQDLVLFHDLSEGYDRRDSLCPHYAIQTLDQRA